MGIVDVPRSASRVFQLTPWQRVSQLAVVFAPVPLGFGLVPSGFYSTSHHNPDYSTGSYSPSYSGAYYNPGLLHQIHYPPGP